MAGNNPELVLRRFHKKWVRVCSGCWEWQGSKDKDGYGRFHVDGGETPAHRFSYELSIRGPIPEGMIVMHSCDNPSCVKPTHLSLGTHKLNAEDRNAKQRQARGESNKGGGKLTDNDIPQIRSMLKEGKTGRFIASIFDVSPTMISYINTGRHWSHIT